MVSTDHFIMPGPSPIRFTDISQDQMILVAANQNYYYYPCYDLFLKYGYY